MSPRQIFITGVAGCVGHYLYDVLKDRPDTVLHLLVRDPAKLRFDAVLPHVHLIHDDLSNIGRYGELLAQVDAVIHLATAWGGERTRAINHDATHTLFGLAEQSRKFLYFSTASILGRDNRPLAEAEQFGTDYIRTKAETYRTLKASPVSERLTTLFPTLIFGGGPAHPYSHLSSGLGELQRWAPWLRYLTLDATFHYIHARDLAQITAHLLDAPQTQGDFVLGNPAVSAEEVLTAVNTHFHLNPRRPLELTPYLKPLSLLFRHRMNDWDRFCMTYRHFAYQETVHAETFGLPSRHRTLAEILAEAVPVGR